jgi:2-C-methyl-D-erythritol 4-phosphate cytidylyltransferase
MELGREIQVEQSDSVFAVVVAGGMGTRMNAGVPKQFLSLKGKPVVQWSLDCFNQTPEVEEIVLVLPESWLDEGRDKLIGFDPLKPFSLVAGGETRQDSVSRGLDSIAAEDGWVIIHDGARPAISHELIIRTLKQAKERGNAVCAVPSNDTLVKVSNGQVVSQVDRNEIYRVQTPQIFRLAKIRKALEFARQNGISGTDDSSLMREIGETIHLVEGTDLNVKITREDDLEILEALL